MLLMVRISSKRSNSVKIYELGLVLCGTDHFYIHNISITLIDLDFESLYN